MHSASCVCVGLQLKIGHGKWSPIRTRTRTTRAIRATDPDPNRNPKKPEVKVATGDECARCPSSDGNQRCQRRVAAAAATAGRVYRRRAEQQIESVSHKQHQRKHHNVQSRTDGRTCLLCLCLCQRQCVCVTATATATAFVCVCVCVCAVRDCVCVVRDSCVTRATIER